jgi:hypothetical protein
VASTDRRPAVCGEDRSTNDAATLTKRVTLATLPEKETSMRRYIIERDLPAIGSADREALKQAASKSNQVLKQLAPDIQWIESYVAGDKTFCVYLAKDEGVIHKHAALSGFPANRITEIKKMIDPTTANA